MDESNHSKVTQNRGQFAEMQLELCISLLYDKGAHRQMDQKAEFYGQNMEYCSINDAAQHEELWRSLAADFPGLAVKRRDCLSHCHRCAAVMFALVGDERIIEATSEHDLLRALRAHLRKTDGTSATHASG